MARRLYLLAAVFAVLALAAFSQDLTLARFFRHQGIPGDLRKLVQLAEVVAHGIGVAAILMVVYALDPGHRRRLPRLVALAFGAGLMANIVKCCVARARPRTGDLDRVWDSFAGWLPYFTWPSSRAWNNDWQSFPSGHTATAMGLAIGLCWAYPRGKWLFLTFAGLAGVQRMAADAHYASDVLAATSLACLWCGACCDLRGLGRWFERLETRPSLPSEVGSILPFTGNTSEIGPADPPEQAGDERRDAANCAL